MTDEGKARVQVRVDALASVFVDTVARNRGVSVERVLSDFGQRDLLVGGAAVAAGMADSMGTFESVLADLASGRADGNKPTGLPFDTFEAIAADAAAAAMKQASTPVQRRQ